MNQVSKQCTIDLNLSILTNERDLQVMNQKMQKKKFRWKLLTNSK